MSAKRIHEKMSVDLANKFAQNAVECLSFQELKPFRNFHTDSVMSQHIHCCCFISVMPINKSKPTRVVKLF